MQISIDNDKCTSCGLCIKECIQGIFKDAGSEIIVHRPDFCYLCSHCVAVCPTDAIEHSAMDAAQIERLGPLPENAASTYRHIIRLERSVRNYKDRPVPREIIEDLLDTARYSPSAHNDQNVKYTVVTDRDLLKRISKKMMGRFAKLLGLGEMPGVRFALNIFKDIKPVKGINSYLENSDFYKSQIEGGRDFIFYDAPVLILLHAKPAAFVRDNCLIAATNIANHASSQGLGTCFMGILIITAKFDRKLRNRLGIPPGEKLYTALVCGYPEYNFQKTVSRKPVRVKWI